MIPALRIDDRPASLAMEYVAELRVRGFEGDVAHSHGERTVFATDNSIYQVAPQAVLFPRHDVDVVRIAKLAGEPRFRALKLAPRGGGTGTNGQSLTESVSVDFSRHMNAILEVNVEEGWARVQAGVVKDQLNAAIAKHRLFFAPELSTSNRATIGGMIATDASGQGSVLYGKTRDHVVELRAVLLDGTDWHSRPLTPEELEAAKGRSDRVGHVLRVLDRIRRDDAELIAERFPKLNRCVTGYDLVHLCDCAGRFDLSAVICGAEGTLALVTEATLRLHPRLSETASVLAPFATVDEVAAVVPRIVGSGVQPMILEYIDRGTMKGLLRMNDLSLGIPDDVAAATEAYLVVVLEGRTRERVEEDLGEVAELLGAAGAHDVYVLPSGQGAALLAARESAFWMVKAAGADDLVDMVVPRDKIPEYLRRVQDIARGHGSRVFGCGHAGDGNIHFSVYEPDDERREHLLHEIYAMGMGMGGAISGEHGIGRTKRAHLEALEDPAKLALWQRIKVAFDPHGILNPGVVLPPAN